MKRFIKKTLLFLLPIFVLGFIMELFLRNISNDYQYKKEYLDQNAHEIETLILGSSHAYYGLDPAFFSKKAFNASYISQSLNYDFEILKKYENHFNNLETLIIPISYFSFYGDLATDKEAWRIKNYAIYYKINAVNSFTDYSEMLSNNLEINIKRLISYYVKQKTNIKCSTLGWGTDYNSKNTQDLIETGESAAKRHSKNNINLKSNQVIFNRNVVILNSIISWCESRNVKIIFFTPPAYKTYQKYLNKDQLNLTIETITKEVSHHKNCNYLNLLYDSNFTAQDFYDADHLSEIGAKKLSIKIDKL